MAAPNKQYTSEKNLIPIQINGVTINGKAEFNNTTHTWLVTCSTTGRTTEMTYSISHKLPQANEARAGEVLDLFVDIAYDSAAALPTV